jgi:single-stranded DNA-specific DHH superfamily exonuclease
MLSRAEQATLATELRLKLERRRLMVWRTIAQALADVSELDAASVLFDSVEKVNEGIDAVVDSEANNRPAFQSTRSSYPGDRGHAASKAHRGHNSCPREGIPRMRHRF